MIKNQKQKFAFSDDFIYLAESFSNINELLNPTTQ